ncbi:uncharacterized protein LOC131068284 [Cryptomeria japonica]|uniref:uncharacterized protein LOC131068284 n=1 Tax=Cryptomeria japonica TaxID=3369 RepID=UPI0025AB7241|nr:uncharacterized protein LOC131068284 [Cryptomeria japonica]
MRHIYILVTFAEDTRPRRVKFSSLDTIHTFADESVPCRCITVGKSMPQRTVCAPCTLLEVENPKTSEYRYFKKLKTFSDQKLTCLQSSKSENEHQGLVAYKHFSEVMNGNITDSCDRTKESIHNQTCLSPFLEEQSLDVRARNSDNHLLEKDKPGPAATSSSHCEIDGKSDLMCSPSQIDFKKADNYGKVFHKKRKKLQDLCARALSIETGDFLLYGSKSVMILLQRLKAPNDSNIGTESQEDPEFSKDISVGTEKPIQSNFHPETYICLDLKDDFKKACSQFDILSNAEGLGYKHCNKILNTKTSNFQREESLSLISSWEADKVHQYDYDSYGYGLHGLAHADLGTHSLCTKEQLAQEARIDHGNILDTKFWHFPPVFSRMWSDDYNHKQSLEDFPLFTDILQPNRHYVFDSLPVKRDELSLIQWYDKNCKSPNFSSMKSINMQLVDHIDKFRCHGQGFPPETGMILWTLPENNLCFGPLLAHEDKHKHYEKESIPGNSMVLWGSSYKDIPRCDKIEDFSFQDISQNLSLAPFVCHNDQDNIGPDLGFSFSSKQLQHGTDSLEWKESSLFFLSSESNLLEVQHKLLNTDGLHLIEEVQDPGVSTLISFPYRIKESTDSPMDLHLELEDDVNIPNICVTKGEEWERLAEPMYLVDCDYDSYGAEHVGLKC